MNPAVRNQIVKFIPRLGGALVFVGVGLGSVLTAWEPGKNAGIVYADTLAGGLPTVCNGITKHVTKTPIIIGEVWSPAKCAGEEASAIERMQDRLVQCFTKLPPQSVFDMASSHAWNNGVANTCSSQAMVAWNAGDWALGCRRLSVSDAGKPVWSFVRTGKMLPDGKPEMKFVKGLANRRADETNRCIKGLS